MQDNKTTEAQYQKGFNEGYLLSKHDSDLASKLATVKGDYPRLEGMRDGMQEHSKEVGHYPAWAKRNVAKLYSDKGKKAPEKDKE